MTQPEITDHLIAIASSLAIYFAGYYRGKRAGIVIGANEMMKAIIEVLVKVQSGSTHE